MATNQYSSWVYDDDSNEPRMTVPLPESAPKRPYRPTTLSRQYRPEESSQQYRPEESSQQYSQEESSQQYRPEDISQMSWDPGDYNVESLEEGVWRNCGGTVCDSSGVYYPTPYYDVGDIDTRVASEKDDKEEEHVDKPKLGVSYKSGYYSGEIKTRLCDGVYYLSVRDILEYVTRGGRVCDSYLEGLEEYIKDEMPDLDVVQERVEKIDGSVYMRDVPKVSWESYGRVGMLCLTWAVSNPEKLA